VTRAFILVVLSTQITSTAATPIASLPASSRGFDFATESATAPAPISDVHIHTDEFVEPTIPALNTPFPNIGPTEEQDEDQDWDLEYDEAADADMGMGVDAYGNAVAKGMDRTK
jgi:hypothetical protein